MAGPAAAQDGGSADSAQRRAMTALVLRRLSRFAAGRGIPAGREFLLDYDVIEAFCVTGLRGRACSTRGTYRSALYRLAEAAHGPPGQRPTPFPGAKAPPPYPPGERAELAALAAARRDPAKRSPALAMAVFGIGAGLRPGELVALRGDDIVRHGRQVRIQVTVLLAVTGIAEAGSLARYARHVAGIGSSKGTLRARWRAERTR